MFWSTFFDDVAGVDGFCGFEISGILLMVLNDIFAARSRRLRGQPGNQPFCSQTHFDSFRVSASQSDPATDSIASAEIGSGLRRAACLSRTLSMTFSSIRERAPQSLILAHLPSFPQGRCEGPALFVKCRLFDSFSIYQQRHLASMMTAYAMLPRSSDEERVRAICQCGSSSSLLCAEQG